MRRAIIVVALVAAAGAGAYYLFSPDGGPETTTGRPPGGGGGGFGGFGPGGFGGGGGGGPRMPMTVELASVRRADLAQRITVVGNLVGKQTVAASPKISGRLDAVPVRLGDRVTVGQELARIEDSELIEQVKQAEASFAVSAATIRQREADLGLAKTNLDRSSNLFQRQLISRQTFDDAEARYQAGQAQLDLAQAQHAQAQARLDELKINVASTVITSPVNGFVASRALDPGAWVTPSTALISVVDISVVRIIANVVERDLRLITTGLTADVEVDAYPGEKFAGRVAHVAPVLDPATRTAQIEIDIQNPQFRLKPGMYAKVNFTVDRRENALVVPTTALVDVGGNRGVFQPSKGERGDVAAFKKIEVGLIDQDLVEVASGLSEGEAIVTTGAAALRVGDRIVLSGGEDNGAGGRGRAGGPGAARGRNGGPGRPGADGARPPGNRS